MSAPQLKINGRVAEPMGEILKAFEPLKILAQPDLLPVPVSKQKPKKMETWVPLNMDIYCETCGGKLPAKVSPDGIIHVDAETCECREAWEKLGWNDAYETWEENGALYRKRDK